MVNVFEKPKEKRTFEFLIFIAPESDIFLTRRISRSNEIHNQKCIAKLKFYTNER